MVTSIIIIVCIVVGCIIFSDSRNIMSILVVVGCADVGYNIYMATQSILFTVLAVIVTGGVITFIGFQFNEAKITRALGFTSRKERYEFEREILLSNRVVKNEHQHSDQKVK